MMTRLCVKLLFTEKGLVWMYGAFLHGRSDKSDNIPLKSWWFIPVMYYSLIFWWGLGGGCFPSVPKQHYGSGPKGLWDAWCRLHTHSSVLCNLKWLPLSSRLLASCCPKCWSLRSRMRLLQRCEPTQGKMGGKKRTYSTLFICSDMCKDIFFSFLFFKPLLYNCNILGHLLKTQKLLKKV